MPRQHHADRLYLVDRGIGAVASAREGIEQHFAFQFAAQACRQRHVTDTRGGVRGFPGHGLVMGKRHNLRASPRCWVVDFAIRDGNLPLARVIDGKDYGIFRIIYT
jgi:hypothetical protein